MAVYTVHEPPVTSVHSDPEGERFLFVRDGFSFWAFLLGPVWMLRHRMWLILVGYVAAAAALEGAFRAVGASFGQRFLAGLLLALLIGLEAPTLRRFTLARRKWRNIGITIAEDLEAAERRFYASWTAAPDRRPVAPSSAASAMSPPRASGSEVIGLFPSPGGNR